MLAFDIISGRWINFKDAVIAEKELQKKRMEKPSETLKLNTWYEILDLPCIEVGESLVFPPIQKQFSCMQYETGELSGEKVVLIAPIID